MAALGGEGLWCGASLRPWQILHSRLARMHTCSLLERDVWELMDETVQAASLHNHPLREDKKEELQILEGDDGELWRHGGLMEARIRDWLTSRIEEDQSKEAPIILHPNYDDNCISTTFSNEFRAAHAEEHVAGDVACGFSEDVHPEEDGVNYGCNGPYTIFTCRNESNEAWDSTYLEQAVCEAVADALGSRIYEEDEADGEENHSAITTNAAILAAPLDAEAHFCQFSEDLQAIGAKGAEQLHEEAALCAVCLEKLYINEEELQVIGYINDVTCLPCRHSFHSSCLSPWLSASSLCPCCRAPITLSCALHVEVPPNLGVEGANCSDRVQREMMGLVAEVEAALDRFGLLS